MSSRRAFYAAIAAAALVAGVLSWFVSERSALNLSADNTLIKVTQVQRLQPTLEPGALPSAGEERWEPIDLPNDWLANSYGRASEWYRFRIQLNVPPDRLWELMLSSVNLNAGVYVNQRLLGVNGSLEEPISHNWNQPLSFAIPNGLLVPGSNEIMIKVVSFPPGHGLLGPVYLGPREAVQAQAQNLRFINVEVSRFITGLSFTLFAVSLGLWLLRRGDSEYLWFSLMTLLWTIHSMKYHVTEIPISSQFWGWLLSATSISLSYPLHFFLMRIHNRHNPRLERTLFVLLGISLLALTVALLRQDMIMYDIGMVAYAISFCVSVYAFISLSIHCARTRDIEAFWIAVTISALVVFVVHDFLRVFGLLDRSSGQLVVYAMPLLLVSFGMVILRRFATALREREDIVANLEERVADAAQTIVDLEKERALTEQRETIMRDMHDGVGGQLVSSLALLETGERKTMQHQLQDLLQRALIDLRLMVDSMDTDAADLHQLLGALRDRMEPVLRASGMTLTWNYASTPTLVGMTPHKGLQVLRILQEALTNTIRHANATHVTIDVGHTDAKTAFIRLTDNGDGFPAQQPQDGRGLRNMIRRASDIGGSLDINSGPSGTRIELTLTA